jgi:hypothetical protein
VGVLLGRSASCSSPLAPQTGAEARVQGWFSQRIDALTCSSVGLSGSSVSWSAGLQWRTGEGSLVMATA